MASLRFNGATTLTSWKTWSRKPMRFPFLYGFNGATTLTSWKTLESGEARGILVALQWGHDFDVVEDARPT